MRLARLGTLTLLLLPACADIAGPETLDDAGALPPASDGSAPSDAGLNDGSPGPLSDERSDAPGTCYDGVDNDRDALGDCSDSDCTLDAVCCVGSAACCAPAGGVTLAVPASCDDLPLASCAALDPALHPFGGVLPGFEDGGLVPQGGVSWGGVALGDAVDPRAFNVTLTADVAVPDGGCTDCVDAAGVGLFEAIPAAGERASARLGVLVNGARGEVQVLVADRPVATEPLPEGARTITLAIELSIDGVATVRGIPGASDLVLTDADLPSALTPVVFGRTDERTTEPAVRVLAAEVALDHCDVPAAVERRAAPVLPASSVAWRPSALGRVAVVDLGTPTEPRRRVVFEDAGSLLVAGENGIGELVGASGPPDPLLAAPAGYESIHDPWLLLDGDVVVLYFAAERPDGKRELLRAVGGPAGSFALSAPEPVAIPAEIASIDGPTVWIEDLAAGVWRMIARVDDGDGPRLASLRSMDGGGRFEWAHGDLESSTVRGPAPDDAFAIDRDEVAEPALLRIGSTWRLYYAGRRGQRWSIGLLVSETGDAWRAMPPVLEGDGTGFDALGARSPAPSLDASGAARLHYVGTDGTDSLVGLAGPAGTLGE